MDAPGEILVEYHPPGIGVTYGDKAKHILHLPLKGASRIHQGCYGRELQLPLLQVYLEDNKHRLPGDLKYGIYLIRPVQATPARPEHAQEGGTVSALVRKLAIRGRDSF